MANPSTHEHEHRRVGSTGQVRVSSPRRVTSAKRPTGEQSVLMDPTRVVSGFLADAVADSGPVRFALRHPVRLLTVMRAVRRLPVLLAAPGDGPDGRALRAGLQRGPRLARAATAGLTAVIVLPGTAAEYEAGGSKRSLRRGIAAARRAGVTSAMVDEEDVREELIAQADEFERTHPREEYRTAAPDNRDLLDLSAWFAARSADGALLALVIAGWDGPWVTLRYLRITSTDPLATHARDLLVRALVEESIDRGARWIATDTSPIRLESGLRISQQRMGFTLMRVQVRTRPGGDAVRRPRLRTRRVSVGLRRG